MLHERTWLSRGSLFGLLAIIFTNTVASDITPLQRATLLSRSGASDLALRVLNQLQPSVNDSQKWIEWEKLRFTILRQRQEWQILIDRVSKLPAELPLLQQQALMTEAVKTLIPSGQGVAARRFLRELLWRGSGDSKQISSWRRLVIRSYLEQQDGLADARIAMERYQNEYLPNDADWAYLFGRILLLSGKPQEAAAQLATMHSDEGRLLRIVARLRAGIDEPALAKQQVRDLLKDLKEDSEVRPRAWGLLAEIGNRGADHELVALALEQFIGRSAAKDELFKYSPDDLWQAYSTLAEDIGNAENLLVGDPTPWLQAAAKAKDEHPAKYRAIYALLGLNSEDPSRRQRYFSRVYTSLQEVGVHDAAVRLFRDSRRFPNESDIPDAVRHNIVQYAIVRRDIPLAGRMSKGLEQPGSGQDGIDWSLTRARLALFTGRFDDAVSILHKMLGRVSALEPKVADRLIQVLFDLQSVGQHKAAYELFSKVHDLVPDNKQKRELLFWMADALHGDKRYEEAAEMYFRSALFGDNSYDIWGQTARYRAAESLAENGALKDARQVYENLIKVTDDPKRIVALERRLQGLWLKDQQQQNK